MAVEHCFQHNISKTENWPNVEEKLIVTVWLKTFLPGMVSVPAIRALGDKSKGLLGLSG